MFFENSRIGPAAGTIEFRDHGWTALYAELIDTILIAVKRQKPTIAFETEVLQEPEVEIRRHGHECVLDTGHVEERPAHLHEADRVVVLPATDPHLGAAALSMQRTTTSGLLYVYQSVTGLEPGREYELTAQYP